MTAPLVRNDIHRPSVIEPLDYEYVGIEYDRVDDVIGGCMMLNEERKNIRAHMARTGGKYSNHEHGGNCHICGAGCIYTALFYHPVTNTYIRTGFDCADKMHMGDTVRFRAFRAAIMDARELTKGINKAKAVLADAGLTRAWEIYKLDTDSLRALGAVRTITSDGQPHDVRTEELGKLTDIVERLVKWGSLSEKQLNFVGLLVKRIDNKVAYEAEQAAKKAAERAFAADCPTGKVVISGEILSTKVVDGYYGSQTKMLVREDLGFKVWGTVPAAIGSAKKGDKVTFTATVKPSDDDSKFGFFSRPTKASVVSVAAETAVAE